MRELTSREQPLVAAIYRAAGTEMPEHLRVQDMSDGGMGSLLIRPGSSIKRFKMAELFFLDEDGVLVSAVLNGTSDGEPAELDLWKVDYSPLRRWPTAAQIYDVPPDSVRGDASGCSPTAERDTPAEA